MKKVVIFGSTGSIGRNALDIIRKSKGEFRVLGLCANKDIKTLLSQIKEFKPLYVCLRDETQAKKIQQKLDKSIKFFKGEKGLLEFSAIKSDISLMAISGISALGPLLVNIEYTRRVALANKESLVTAGALVFAKARKFNTQILPVDSEINAIFQLIAPGQNYKNIVNDVNRVYLTASGGPLSGRKKGDLPKVGVDEVLNHPTWKMGKRITVDSATLVNKGFEVVEAHHFFGFPYEKIDIVIHRQSFVHAFLEFKDNAVLACLYQPDMKIPISYAFYHPHRFTPGESKSIFRGRKEFSYSFAPIRYSDYPLLELILKAAQKCDNSLIILNACDEVAIDYFLKRKIKFTALYKVMKYLFNHYQPQKIKNIDDVFFWDEWARTKTKEYLSKL